MLLLVAYDVTDDRLRRRLARLLGGYGERVQQSAFECRLRPRERRELVRRLQALLGDPTDDTTGPLCSVRLYPLPKRRRCLELGRGTHPSASDVIIA